MGKDRIGDQVRPYTPLDPAGQAFLQNCARLEPLPAAISLHLDWAAITIRLISDGLAPIAYQQFKDRPDLIPADIFSALKKSYYQNASANHIRLEELKRLGRCLAQHNIPLLVLKGGVLAQTVFPDPALRFMGDLDVAVPPEQTQAALALLQAEGYARQKEPGDRNDERWMREEGWHIILAKTVWGKRMLLEFHWPLRRQVMINQLVYLDVQHIWQTAIPLDQENNLWQPAPPAMLLHLCLHTGVQHRFTDLGLRHYVDLDRLVRLYGGEPYFWSSFAELAEQTGAQHAAAFCLRLTESLLDTPLPAGALGPIQPPEWKRRLFTRSIQEQDVLNRTRALYAHRRWRWRVLTADRLWLLWISPLRSLFPGRAYLASYYATQSGWRLAGYALWHPFHVLSRALGRRLRNRLQHRRSVKGAA
jgi:hypothetical protein